jgi:hypothetical protein
MTLDQYQPCPCGSGKKIKFCCCKDIVQGLDKVMRAVEGEQRVAALDQVNRLIEQHGDREALLALKADVQLSLENFDGARDSALRLLKKVPHNPVALGLSAIIAAMEDEVTLAVERLQEALECTDQVMLPAVYSSINAVAQSLLSHGDVLAARGHWLMQAGLAGDRDRNPVDVLMRIHLAREVPLAMKEDFFYAEPDTDVPWKGEFAAAMTSARRGTWLAACESLMSLSEKAPGQIAILKNIAILRSWLGQGELATAAWRAVAQLESLSIDERVEAEVLAQMLDKETLDRQIDEVTQVYHVEESEPLMEVLLSSKQITPMPVNPAELVDDDEPPPKGAFWLLDRTMIEATEDIRPQDVPRVVGELYLFSKQTDRDARLEFVVTKNDQFVEKVDKLRSVIGDLASEQPKSQEKTGSVSATVEAISWRWRLPNEVTRQQQQALLQEQQRAMLLTTWPDCPLAVLDQKSPREVAADEQYRAPLLAAILVMELNSEQAQRPFDYDLLRENLGLPTSAPLEPGSFDLFRVPLMRMTRIQVDKLSNEELLTVFNRAMLKRHSAAVRHFAVEALQRDLGDNIKVEDIYDALISSSIETDDALRYIDEARQYSLEKGESPARWLLSELSIRLPRMEADTCDQLIQTLQTRHMEEPGIAEGLYRLLVSYGVITPEGQPTTAAGRAGPAPQAVAEPAAEVGQIWTPGGDAAAPAQSAQKSKLWVPGMD